MSSNSSEYFRADAPNVVHEVIDGEAVIVNLNDGAYYSVDKAGAVIWSLIDRGTAVSQIVDAMTDRYAGSRERIEEAVMRLVSELQREHLIVADPERRSKPDDGLNPCVGQPANKPEFEDPVLQKYTDMEDLLLLDPIHEVDETGWPSVKPEDGRVAEELSL
jgi:hypothetical protein